LSGARVRRPDLVGGSRIAVAEATAAASLIWWRAARDVVCPGALPDVGPGVGVRFEGRATDGGHERVVGGRRRTEDQALAVTGRLGRAVVTRRGDEGDALRRRDLEQGVVLLVEL